MSATHETGCTREMVSVNSRPPKGLVLGVDRLRSYEIVMGWNPKKRVSLPFCLITVKVFLLPTKPRFRGGNLVALPLVVHSQLSPESLGCPSVRLSVIQHDKLSALQLSLTFPLFSSFNDSSHLCLSDTLEVVLLCRDPSHNGGK